MPIEDLACPVCKRTPQDLADSEGRLRSDMDGPLHRAVAMVSDTEPSSVQESGSSEVVQESGSGAEVVPDDGGATEPEPAAADAATAAADAETEAPQDEGKGKGKKKKRVRVRGTGKGKGKAAGKGAAPEAGAEAAAAAGATGAGKSAKAKPKAKSTPKAKAKGAGKSKAQKGQQGTVMAQSQTAPDAAGSNPGGDAGVPGTAAAAAAAAADGAAESGPIGLKNDMFMNCSHVICSDCKVRCDPVQDRCRLRSKQDNKWRCGKCQSKMIQLQQDRNIYIYAYMYICMYV